VARSGEFNIATALALLASLHAAATFGDEIRKWRDAEGNLHYSIVGTPGGGGGEPSDEVPIVSTRDPTAEEQFSIEASLRRRKLQRKLKAAGGELEEVRQELRKTQAESFRTWVPLSTGDPASAAASLEAQRDAFLASTQFEQDKGAALRRLKRRERAKLKEIVALWKEFAGLEADVRSRYGGLPGWWMSELDCKPCPSAEEAARALNPPEVHGAAPQKLEKPTPSDDEDDWDEEDSGDTAPLSEPTPQT
jgi:hypothetical protein